MKSGTITKNFGGEAHAKVGLRETHPEEFVGQVRPAEREHWRPPGVARKYDPRAYYRTLEWQEAASLQGFPENYTFIGTRRQAAQMIAQAIQIDTGRAILKAICEEAFA